MLTILNMSQKSYIFLAFNLACPKKTTQAKGCQGKRSGLTTVIYSTLVHALLKSLLYPLYSQFFLLLQIGRFRA